MHPPVPPSEIYLSLVLPAYNESKKIGTTIQKTMDYLGTASYSWELIVVDDGSLDDTAEIARRAAGNNPEVQVLQQPVNQGKGSAVKTGILRATGQYIGFMDADFKTDLSCITDALERLEAGYDVVVGSRRLPQSQIETPHKFYRRVASQLFKYGLHMTFPALRGHQDTQCGFKFFKQNIAHNLFHKLVINRFMFDAEIFFLAHRLKYQISEIPVRWASDPDTRTTLIEGIFRNPYDLFRIRFHHRNL